MELSYWLINTPGLGGLAVVLAFGVLLLIYARVLRWILGGNAATDEGNPEHAP